MHEFLLVLILYPVPLCQCQLIHICIYIYIYIYIYIHTRTQTVRRAGLVDKSHRTGQREQRRDDDGQCLLGSGRNGFIQDLRVWVDGTCGFQLCVKFC